MNILALIPARMGSSRFPGKPMANILGTPMIGHVYKRVQSSSLLTDTAVATCDQEIFNYISSIGGKAIMTSPEHERASDRCAEALNKIEKPNKITYDVVIMVQGDEPMTHPEMIEEVLRPFSHDPKVDVVNLLGKINTQEEFEDRNCIKVVCDSTLNALYFSREPIPTRYRTLDIPMGKQVCVIAFRHDCLLEYTQMRETPLEIAESIDMLRILEHGKKVRMQHTQHVTFAVDTPDDLRRVEDLMKKYTYQSEMPA